MTRRRSTQARLPTCRRVTRNRITAATPNHHVRNAAGPMTPNDCLVTRNVEAHTEAAATRPTNAARLGAGAPATPSPTDSAPVQRPAGHSCPPRPKNRHQEPEVRRVSRIEQGDLSGLDVLDRYVQALGGQLGLVATFGDEQHKVG